MQDEDLRDLWNRMDVKLDRCLRLNEERLRSEVIGGMRASIRRQALGRTLELATGGVLLLWLGSFLFERAAELRWLLVGGALQALVGGIVGFGAYQLVLLSRLDYDGSVTGIQRALERIELVEYRAFLWAFLGGVLLWVFVPAVLFEALWNVDLLIELPGSWIVANLAFGGAVAIAGFVVSRKYVESETASPRMRRIAEHLSGQSLRRARERLQVLAAFEGER